MEHLLLQKNACFVKSSLLTTTSLNKQSAGTLVSISSSLHALSCSSSFHLSLSYAKAQQTLFPFKLSPGFFCRRGKKERKKKWGGEGVQWWERTESSVLLQGTPALHGRSSWSLSSWDQETSVEQQQSGARAPERKAARWGAVSVAQSSWPQSLCATDGSAGQGVVRSHLFSFFADLNDI